MPLKQQLMGLHPYKLILIFLLYLSRWMNGQHLRSFPHDEIIKAFEDRWKNTGILQESESGFAKVKSQAILFSCAPRVSYLEVHIKGALYTKGQ